MAHWVPGFLLVMALRPMILDGSSPPLKSLVGSGAPGDAIATLALAVAALFVGEVLDASRDLLEHVWDCFQGVVWDFFANAGKDKIDQLNASHFTYYVFDCNVSLGLAILLLSHFAAPLFGVSIGLGNGLVVLFLVICLAIFSSNAWRLRSEIASLTVSWSRQEGTRNLVTGA